MKFVFCRSDVVLRHSGSTRPLRRRAGFTLLEVLVAVALSSMLIAAVYASLNLYWNYSTAGQDEVERAQLARALLRQIELDIRSVIYKAQADASDSASAMGTGTSGGTGTDSSTTSSDTSTDTSTETAVDPETAYETTTSGLFGNASMLMMHISKPTPELMFLPGAGPADASSRTSDLVAVAYYVANDMTAGAGTSGLARMEGDRLAMGLAAQGGATAASVSRVQILAPEVTAIQFSYFDGLSWRVDWDSEMLGGIPRAIEVILQVGPTQSAGSNSDTAGQNMYRLVVFLPLAKPVDTSLMAY
jgi:prepilin-type N-terminal cleavage/methylation domain-containing protein